MLLASLSILSIKDTVKELATSVYSLTFIERKHESCLKADINCLEKTPNKRGWTLLSLFPGLLCSEHPGQCSEEGHLRITFKLYVVNVGLVLVMESRRHF